MPSSVVQQQTLMLSVSLTRLMNLETRHPRRMNATILYEYPVEIDQLMSRVSLRAHDSFEFSLPLGNFLHYPSIVHLSFLAAVKGWNRNFVL